MQQLKTCFVGKLNDHMNYEDQELFKSFIKHALFAGICRPTREFLRVYIQGYYNGRKAPI